MSTSPLLRMIGNRRPLGIGITVDEYRRDHLDTPRESVLRRYSTNPRNQTGAWYEHEIESRLTEFRRVHGWTSRNHVNLGHSIVHLTDKYVDVLVNDSLGLELKFLKVGGSLIRPKALVDAIDFSNRPVHCIYVVDGPAWLSGGRGMSNLDYLAHWWEFTCASHLERTISRFMDLQSPNPGS
jgi:hypothetical protein